MKKLTTAMVLIATIAGSASCKKDVIGEGPVSTQTRALTNFTGIDLRMNGNVYFKNEATWKVEVRAKESIHHILETRVIDNRLVIGYSNGKTYDADESISINVSGPGVNRFELTTSGSIYLLNAIQPANLFLRTSGSGNISLQNVTANNIEAESTVSGRINAGGGSAINGKLKTGGSGRIDFSAIAAKKITARIIGSGDIKVKVADQLDATIDGSGSVYFSGYPDVKSDISGSGRLIHF